MTWFFENVENKIMVNVENVDRAEQNSHLCLLLVGRTEVLRASSLTGKDLTRRTRDTSTRGRLMGTTRGTGDTLPWYSNNLRREKGREEEEKIEKQETKGRGQRRRGSGKEGRRRNEGEGEGKEGLEDAAEDKEVKDRNYTQILVICNSKHILEETCCYGAQNKTVSMEHNPGSN